MEAGSPLARKMVALAGLGFQRVDASPIPTESLAVAGNRHRVTMAFPSMGTLVTVTAIDSSQDLIEESAGRAVQEMTRVVGLLDRYDPASALSHLNDRGSIDGPPPELRLVLGRALAHHSASRGLFDPTVQPLIDLFRASRPGPGGDPGAHRLPGREEVRELLGLVDAGAVVMDPRSIRLGRGGMGVTLDGIAKGYVVDRVAAVLSESGLKDFLINAGGDIRSSGRREDGLPWRVAVRDPVDGEGFPDVIPLNGAVATSGSYEVYFDIDRTNHHIVSPRDGISPPFSQSVSVVAPTAIEADALTTTVFLMQPERGVAFIDSVPGCACLIVDRQGRQLRSRRWRSAAEPTTTKAETL